MTTKERVSVIDAATMERLVVALEADPIEGFIEMWRALEPEWDTAESVDPRNYTISRDQSDRLLEAGKVGCANIGANSWVIMGLWLNNGPSTAAK